MKKTTLSLILIAFSLEAFAQGTLNFGNVALAPTTGITTNIPTVANQVPAGTYTMALYWDSTAASAGPGILPDSALLTVEKVYTSNPSDWPFAGQFQGGTVVITGLAAGSTGFFEVVGWTGSFNSFAAALAGGAGFSYTTIFGNGTGGAGTPPASPVNLTGWNGNLNLAIPEPTTITLGGLGAATFLLFRRRKKHLKGSQMVNIFFAMAFITVLSGSAFAQGTLNFANVPLVPTIGIATNQNNPCAAGTYTVALYWDSTASSAGAGINPTSALLTVEKVYTSNPSDWPFAGQFQGGTVVINGLSAGGTGYFEIAAWTGNFGSYQAAIAGLASTAITGVFANGTGGAGSPPASPVNLTGWNGNLSFTPEPSTIALGGLGMAAFLLLRRRNPAKP